MMPLLDQTGTVAMAWSVSYQTLFCQISSRLPAGVHEAGPAEPPKPRLLDRVSAAHGVRHYSRRTEEAYVAWIRRYILFHGKRHPADMGSSVLTRWRSTGLVRDRL